MTRYGYARVSTLDQKCLRQLADLAGDHVREENIVIEPNASTRLAKRPKLEALLAKLQPGDTLVVSSLDRLGRTVTDLIQLIERLKASKVEFVSLKQRIDTSDAMGHFIFILFAGLAQMERDLIRERTLAGLAAARSQGRVGGRKPVLSEEQRELAQSLVDSGQTIVSIARAMKVSRTTVYRALGKNWRLVVTLVYVGKEDIVGGMGHVGVSRFCFTPTVGTDLSAAQITSAHYAMSDFYMAIQDLIPADIVITVDPIVDEFEADTGLLVFEHVDTSPPGGITGTDTDNYANGAGAHISWSTTTIWRGKRVRGGTYVVPLGHSAWALDGHLNPDAVTSINSAASAMVAEFAAHGSTFGVWSRPRLAKTKADPAGTHVDGNFAPIAGGTVSALSGILARRR